MRARVIILLSILSLSQISVAQQWIENGQLKAININLKYQWNGDIHQKEINSILGSIAYTHQKPVELISTQWEMITSYQVLREEKGNFKSDIFIKPKEPQGDFELYEFNSAKYILPVLQSFRMRIFKEDSTLVYLKQFNQNPISVSSVGKIAHFTFVHQRWAKGWYMKIDQFEFRPANEDYTFEQWFQYTNDYKSANYLVESLLENYKELQKTKQETCPFLIKSLRQYNYLKKLYEMPFYKATVAKGLDPDELGRKMNILTTLYDLNIVKYNPIFKESISSNPISIERMVNTYLAEEENLLSIQQSYGSIYDQLFQQLAKTNYPANLSFKNFEFFELIGIDPAERELTIASFENRLYSKSIVNIDNLIVNQQFAEALYSIDNLENFVFYSKALKLNDYFNQYKAKAAYGMYYSYAHLVDKAIQLKNTILAEKYIVKASLVQQTYPELILTNSLIDGKIRRLIDDCYSDFNLMLEQNRYTEMVAKRDTIRNLISAFQLTGVDFILDRLEKFTE